jgi:hypothetical protein
MGKRKTLLWVFSMMVISALVVVFQTELSVCKEAVNKETGQETKSGEALMLMQK